MRLILFISLIGSSLFISIARPFFGLLVFSWLAYMRPQNWIWGAADWRFSYFIALALLAGCLFSAGKEKFFVKTRENYLLIALFIMFAISTVFSMWPGQSFPKLLEMGKIFLIATITGGLVNSKNRFKYLCWIITFSLGTLAINGAIKGVLFGWHLHGPAGSMIGDNNDFALALNMILPFVLYLGLTEKTKWIKYLFYGAFPFIVLAIIYTFSRGGFIGLCAVGFFLAIRSRRKFIGIGIFAAALLLLMAFTPQEHKERMETIKTYEEDKSAMGRIYAWQAAWGMAKSRPLTGVGFRNFLMAFPQYHWFEPRVAHNSYLQILAENGFIAFSIFLLLLFSCIKKLRQLRKTFPYSANNAWIHNYSNMLEIGFIGYMVSGMFLSRGDFDLLYQFIGMTVALDRIAKNSLKKNVGRKDGKLNIRQNPKSLHWGAEI